MNITENTILEKYEDDLLASALTSQCVNTLDEFFYWFDSREQENEYSVRKIPVNEIEGWVIDDETGDIRHKSGKFFSIVGLDVKTNYGITPQWDQPIINQPEIGILGFITQKKNGILHFLVQAKMEPGNVNLLQVSPTLQATKSNYTSVHGGNKPAYLEYFINHTKSNVLFDQLQSEQGARFYRKRNRNIIIEINPDEVIEVLPDFYWLTLGQILDLLKHDNIINMDSRTVLSIIEFEPNNSDLDDLFDYFKLPSFSRRLLESSLYSETLSHHKFNKVISWFTNLKTIYEMDTKFIPLKDTRDWEVADGVVKNKDSKFFSVIGVSVEASSREVSSWQQPLIESVNGGVIAFICQMKNGILHFLVQARVEPGNFDIIELAPTLQLTPKNYLSPDPKRVPAFYDLLESAKPDQIKYDQMQSEEGGRFYHDRNRYQIIEIGKDLEIDIPENYNWMTINQIKKFIKFNNYFNIEARGLLSCLNYRNME